MAGAYEHRGRSSSNALVPHNINRYRGEQFRGRANYSVPDGLQIVPFHQTFDATDTFDFTVPMLRWPGGER